MVKVRVMARVMSRCWERARVMVWHHHVVDLMSSSPLSVIRARARVRVMMRGCCCHRESEGEGMLFVLSCSGKVL